MISLWNNKKRETFHSCVFKSRSCLCNCRRWDKSSKPFSIFSYEETAVNMRSPTPAARNYTHTHACARELRNCLWRYTGTVSSSWGRKGKQGQRVTTCSNSTGKSETEGEREDRWRHSGKSIPGATCDVTCRMGVDWRKQWRKQLRDLP